MAVPARGETRVRIDGEDRVLAYDLNALCQVEEALGEPLSAVAARLGRPALRDLRALLWAGLQRHYPGTTLAMAGDLLGETLRAGESSAGALGERIAEAIAQSFPPPRPAAAPPPATPTGPRSTRRRSRPASTPAAPGD